MLNADSGSQVGLLKVFNPSSLQEINMGFALRFLSPIWANQRLWTFLFLSEMYFLILSGRNYFLGKSFFTWFISSLVALVSVSLLSLSCSFSRSHSLVKDFALPNGLAG